MIVKKPRNKLVSLQYKVDRSLKCANLSRSCRYPALGVNLILWGAGVKPLRGGAAPTPL